MGTANQKKVGNRHLKIVVETKVILHGKNKELLEKRDELQKKIDDWHKKRKGNKFNLKEYSNFLKKIGYLKKSGPNFKIRTKNVDNEIAKICGPQLVVPIMNAVVDMS